MIIFLLLIIIAILLLGVSRFIGAIGMFLGVMAGFGALVALALWLSIDIMVMFFIVMGLLTVYGFWAWLAGYMTLDGKPIPPEERERRRKI